MGAVETFCVAVRDASGEERVLHIQDDPSSDLLQRIKRRVWAAGYTGTEEYPVPFAIFVTQMELVRAELNAELERGAAQQKAAISQQQGGE